MQTQAVTPGCILVAARYAPDLIGSRLEREEHSLSCLSQPWQHAPGQFDHGHLHNVDENPQYSLSLAT